MVHPFPTRQKIRKTLATQEMVFVYIAESARASRVKCLVQEDNAIVLPQVELKTLNYGNTRNKNVQLVWEHCCETSFNLFKESNVARFTFHA